MWRHESHVAFTTSAGAGAGTVAGGSAGHLNCQFSNNCNVCKGANVCGFSGLTCAAAAVCCRRLARACAQCQRQCRARAAASHSAPGGGGRRRQERCSIRTPRALGAPQQTSLPCLTPECNPTRSSASALGVPVMWGPCPVPPATPTSPTDFLHGQEPVRPIYVDFQLHLTRWPLCLRQGSRKWRAHSPDIPHLLRSVASWCLIDAVVALVRPKEACPWF